MAPCSNVCRELCNVCRDILLNIADSTVAVKTISTHVKIMYLVHFIVNDIGRF